MTILSVDSLSVSYGGNRILSDISFSLEEGDFLAVVGPNGGGKTTLIRSLLGLLEIESGSVLLAANNAAGKGNQRAPLRTGYLPQRSSWADPLFPATVREVVASGLGRKHLFHRHPGAQAQTAVDRALTLLQIENLSGQKVGLLSGGQQQRTHLARALVGNPGLLVLDEPTGALDPSTRVCFFKTLAAIQKTKKTTVIIVTHDTHHLADFAQKILYLDRQVIFFGPVGEYERLDAAHYFGRGHQECAP